MNRAAWTIFGLLLLSNLGWWWASSTVTSGTPGDAVAPARAGLQEQLEVALARVHQLEARPAVSTPAVARTSAVLPPQSASKPHAVRAELDARELRARALSKAWRSEIFQIESAARRFAGLAAVREALRSDDPVEVQAALRAFTSAGSIDPDPASARPLVLPLLESADDAVRYEALRALGMLLDEQGDLPLVLRAFEDSNPDVRWWAGRLSGRFPASQTEATLVPLLDDPDARVRGELLIQIGQRGLTGPLGQRVLELCSDPERRDEMIDRCLSNISDPSPAVIEVLLESVRSGRTRSTMALRFRLPSNLPEASRVRVSEFFMQEAMTKPWPHGRAEALDFVERYGDASHLPRLEALASNDLATERVRGAARDAIAAIRGRMGG